MISDYNKELVPRGNYHVGDKIFKNKIHALSYGDANNIHPTWDFNDEWFSRFDWTIEPSESLETLYSRRCEELRDRYSWLVLHYSGGSDSHNILVHFWKNNIHIDEIIVAQPLEYFEKFTSVSLDKDPSAAHNEWHLTLKPDLEWIKKHLPETKIALYDYTKEMLNFDIDQDWVQYAGEHMNPGIVNRFNRYTNITNLDVYNKHNVGHIYGIDKPLVFKADNHWYSSFLDSIISIQSSYKPVFDKHSHVYAEYFYWAPEAARLLIKQAHMIKNYFEENPSFIRLATHTKKSNEDRNIERNIVRQIVYPYWRKDVFQIKKATTPIWKEHDDWFFTLASESAKSRWFEGYNYIINSVNKKWYNYDTIGRPAGLTGLWSKWHRLD